jgi:Tfp pilus assembly protein FimT
MKHVLKRIIRNVKSVKGNSLAEFATTTALMATLAATAAPKLSEMSEGAKAEKSRNEIDKIIKQAGQFYQDTAESEGRGRFPGQQKFNVSVGNVYGSADYDNGDNQSGYDLGADETKSSAHETAILKDLGLTVDEYGAFTDADCAQCWNEYDDTPATVWTSVFGVSNADNPAADSTTITQCADCVKEWSPLFGDEVLKSTFQDGHFVYSVVAGGGTGVDVYPPIIYVADMENAADFNNVLMP